MYGNWSNAARRATSCVALSARTSRASVSGLHEMYTWLGLGSGSGVGIGVGLGLGLGLGSGLGLGLGLGLGFRVGGGLWLGLRDVHHALEARREAAAGRVEPG